MALALGALLALPLGAAATPRSSTEITLSRFGRVILTSPATTPSQVVLLASGDEPHDRLLSVLTREATERGALVVEFDTRAYLAAAEVGKSSCTYAAADLEALSQRVQKQLALPVYRPPILVGYSSGATLVDTALGQAPPNTFRGAIRLGLRPALKTVKPLCAGHGAPRRSIEILPEAGSDFAAEKSWLPHFRNAWAELSVPLPVTTPPAALAEIADLPLIEVPAASRIAVPSSPLAIILSGDGGWAGLDRELAGALAQRGIPTVGWNTLSYFWTARTQEGMANDLARVLRHYQASWRRDRVLLIGYSYGADVLPFMASRLPADLSARIAGVALLGPSPRTAFEFHVSNWLGDLAGGADDEHPVLPEVKSLAAKLPGVPLLCLYGEKEPDSLCPEIRPPLGKTISFSGAHHFGGNYGEVADALVTEFAPRLVAAPAPAAPAPK
ncbi:MAG TPA: AcvB/VirJ family lysyl-phosphatidylglycerol hydrolase [Thermoanaerobaculia bacterium]|jgi:type IV secretory pathway VirJ component|nr:AcvB/VirJ family lysyl-phosphatidylglycerol hydrolase [Thermoanaerobaculia bacterium]